MTVTDGGPPDGPASSPRWFGQPVGSDDVTWSAPIQVWWKLRQDFAAGRPVDSDVELPGKRASIVLAGDVAVSIEGMPGFTRVLRRDEPALVDDVDAALRCWPRQLSVTVTDAGDVTTRLADGLRGRGWTVSLATLSPTTVRVAWSGPDDEYTDDRGIHLYCRVSGRGSHRHFGVDAHAAAEYIAALPALRLVAVDRRRDQRALTDLRDRLTDLRVAWREDHSDDDGPIAGAPFCADGLGLQFVLRGHGWMTARIQTDDRCITSSMSNMRDSWTDLLAALNYLTGHDGSAFCALVEEPRSKHLIFTRIADHAGLTVRNLEDAFYGDPSHPHGGSKVATWNGGFLELVTAVVTASRSLIDNAGPEVLEDRWLEAPLSRLDLLEKWLAERTDHDS